MTRVVRLNAFSKKEEERIRTPPGLAQTKTNTFTHDRASAQTAARLLGGGSGAVLREAAQAAERCFIRCRCLKQCEIVDYGVFCSQT